MAFGQFFIIFTIRGDPPDLWGVKISGKENTDSKFQNKTCFCNQHEKTNTKMGGRSLMDKFGLYGSPLLYCLLCEHCGDLCRVQG